MIARGVCRLLQSYDFSSLTEFVPSAGLRVDVMAVGPKAEIWVIECKSSRADFLSDKKWHGYIEWADRFFWAVSPDFPVELLPQDAGLIFADNFGGEVVNMPEVQKLPAARRKLLLRKFGRTAADRLQFLNNTFTAGSSVISKQSRAL